MSISTHFLQSSVLSVVLRILVDRLTTLLRRALSSGLFQMQNTQRHGTYAILYYSTAHNSLWRLLLYIFPSFQNCARCEKDLKDNKDNSIHLARKYARIFVLGHYLFLVAHSFPRSRKTVRFSEQTMSADKYPSIFSHQMPTVVYITSCC